MTMLLDEKAAALVNATVPKPAPPCSKCKGKGSYYDPPLEEQRQQIASGTRKITSQIVCDCYSVR
jgi:hypothetical protein